MGFDDLFDMFDGDGRRRRSRHPDDHLPDDDDHRRDRRRHRSRGDDSDHGDRRLGDLHHDDSDHGRRHLGDLDHDDSDHGRRRRGDLDHDDSDHGFRVLGRRGRLRDLLRRHRWLMVTAAVVGLLLLVGAVLLAVMVFRHVEQHGLQSIFDSIRGWFSRLWEGSGG